MLSLSTLAPHAVRDCTCNGEIVARTYMTGFLAVLQQTRVLSFQLQLTSPTLVYYMYSCMPPTTRHSYHDELSSRTYEALAREVLCDGTVSAKGRTKLRLHRQKNGVDSLHHLRVLKKLGWSLDQLEEGTILNRPVPSEPASPQATRK